MKCKPSYEMISSVTCLFGKRNNIPKLLSSVFKHFSYITRLNITGEQTYELFQTGVTKLNYLEHLTIDANCGTIQFSAISLFRNLKTLSLIYSCPSKKSGRKRTQDKVVEGKEAGTTRERILIPTIKALNIIGEIHESDMKSLLNCV